VNRVVEHGVFVSLSAGNDGDAGLFDTESPSSGRNIMAVANLDNIVIPQWAAQRSDGLELVISSTVNSHGQGYISTGPFNLSGPLPIYFTAKTDADLIADACQPLPDDTPDLSQFVVVVKRGTCFISDKITNLEEKNATRILYASSL
jgi:hypothetical protein